MLVAQTEAWFRMTPATEMIFVRESLPAAAQHQVVA
jgi:hypothetical protein